MAGKTEWEDALIRHGIIEAPPRVPTDEEVALAAQEALAAVYVARAATVSAVCFVC